MMMVTSGCRVWHISVEISKHNKSTVAACYDLKMLAVQVPKMNSSTE